MQLVHELVLTIEKWNTSRRNRDDMRGWSLSLVPESDLLQPAQDPVHPLDDPLYS